MAGISVIGWIDLHVPTAVLFVPIRQTQKQNRAD
jgi:hypothetical protein